MIFLNVAFGAVAMLTAKILFDASPAEAFITYFAACAGLGSISREDK